MEREQDTQKIFFKDLLFAACYRWKAIVIFALLFGLLLGGFAVLKNSDTLTLAGTTMTPENDLVVEQLKATIASQKKDLDQQTEYLDHSVLMAIDPYSAYTATMLLFVTPDDYDADRYDPSVSILYCYKTAILDESTMQDMARQHNMSSLYFRELVASSIPSDTYLELTVRAKTEEDAKAYLASIQAALQAKKEAVTENTAPHTITISSFCSGPKYDSTLYNQQNTAQQRLKNSKAEYAVNETELNSLLPTEIIIGSKKPLLFALVGALLGGCLVVAYAWVAHVGSAKIYSARTLTGQTGIRVLGCVATGKKADPITRWLRKLEGRSDYTKLDAVAANIRNRCSGVKTLLIMGEYQEEAVDALVQALEQDGISCVLCKDPYHSADALDALPGCDAVVLAETCGATRYDRVAWAMELVADHQKPLLGCVLMNG